jgi:hypothetical protein
MRPPFCVSRADCVHVWTLPSTPACLCDFVLFAVRANPDKFPAAGNFAANISASNLQFHELRPKPADLGLKAGNRAGIIGNLLLKFLFRRDLPRCFRFPLRNYQGNSRELTPPTVVFAFIGSRRMDDGFRSAGISTVRGPGQGSPFRADQSRSSIRSKPYP